MDKENKHEEKKDINKELNENVIENINNDNVPEVKKFKEYLFENLYASYAGIWWWQYTLYNTVYITADKKEEIKQIISEFDPEDPQTAFSVLITQETDKKIWNFLGSIWLRLKEKYSIKELVDKKNAYYIYPNLIIKDPIKFWAFLKKIKAYEDDIMYRIDYILLSTFSYINSLYNSRDKNAVDLIDFLVDFKIANKELVRLGIRDKTDHIWLKFVYDALHWWYMEDYRLLENLWFNRWMMQKAEWKVYIPLFFEDIHNTPSLLWEIDQLNTFIGKTKKLADQIEKVKNKEIRSDAFKELVTSLYFIAWKIQSDKFLWKKKWLIILQIEWMIDYLWDLYQK